MAPLLIPLVTTLVPEIVKYFAGDKKAEIVQEVANVAMKIAGVQGVDDAAKRIESDPKLSETFRTALLEHEERLREIALEGRRLDLEEIKTEASQVASAQAMQTVALQQEDLFSKRFVYYFAIGWSLFTALYVVFITFINIPKDSVRFADTVLGFLLGTIVASLMQFFYGSSVRSQAKDNTIHKLLDKQ